MNKQGIAPSFLIMLIIALAVLVVAVVLIFQGQEIGGQATKLSPGQDSQCLQKTNLMRNSGQAGSIVDIDEDGRDDSCDWCVCPAAKGWCNNNVVSKGGNDNDGDFLPFGCDEDDTVGKGRTTVEFNKENCVKGINLYELAGGGQQCYFS